MISIGLILLFNSCTDDTKLKNITVPFSGEATIEVGGRFVGVEFHRSQMIPQRISFYYPVANSIDHNKDFWHRDTSFVMNWQLFANDDSTIVLGRNPVDIELNPYSVKFIEKRENLEITASYRFCFEKPAMVLLISIKNLLKEPSRIHFETNLKTPIKTCHTYQLLDESVVNFDENTIYTNFPNIEADSATIFVSNAGLIPIDINADQQNAGFIYEKELIPGESMEIVQIIGSCKNQEVAEIIEYLLENYENEINTYENYIKEYSLNKTKFYTGDFETDKSVAYAKAIMETNKHYLDDEIVPMPCPAEYNFQFTHDQLVTDLVAVNYDLERVKFDLNYIKNHADSNKIIPHAYYWKDGEYRTEFASSDNWNNFWFIIVSASYLRHSNDIQLLTQLYPYLQICKTNALKTLEKDDLMWSYRPDWWDIGHNYGAKSYMTILAIKAVRDFVYISTILGNDDDLVELSQSADQMESALSEKLWSEKHGYLMNYFEDGSLDPHYYIGSLLAPHYCNLDEDKLELLLQTAKTKLLDEKIGIYNAFPMDFEKYKDIIRYVNDEVGAKYYYFNGGIWPQGNAWYALSLIKNGNREEASNFIKNTMSLYGIMKGPNGQPAYYEVRTTDSDHEKYGKVDKPQFLWAGAWYIYSLYNLQFINENSWNLALSPYLMKNQKECCATYSVAGKNIDLSISGESSMETMSSIKYDGIQQYSLVIPTQKPPAKSIKIKTGKVKYPYLKSCNAILNNIDWDNKKLSMELSAFSAHKNEVVVIAPGLPKSVKLNDKEISNWENMSIDDSEKIILNFTNINNITHLVLEF